MTKDNEEPPLYTEGGDLPVPKTYHAHGFSLMKCPWEYSKSHVSYDAFKWLSSLSMSPKDDYDYTVGEPVPGHMVHIHFNELAKVKPPKTMKVIPPPPGISDLPGMKEFVDHPEAGYCYLSAFTRRTLQDMIIHLNDHHKWTREQIADWLETLDIDLRFKSPRERMEAKLEELRLKMLSYERRSWGAENPTILRSYMGYLNEVKEKIKKLEEEIKNV